MRPICLLRKALVSIIFSAIGLFAGIASAAAIQQVNASGELTGAVGVNVGGTLYDVAFVDGTCFAVFSGCDQASDFAFTNAADAAVAAQALIDQVFLDTGLGMFDTQPELTLGCEPGINFCAALVPSSTIAGAVTGGAALNVPAVLGDFPTVFAVNSLDDTAATGGENLVWAVFSAQSLPAPSTLALIGVAVAGVGFSRRKRIEK